MTKTKSNLHKKSKKELTAQKKIRSQKIHKRPINQKKYNLFNKIKSKLITKENMFYTVLLILDIAIIIYSARHNYANYILLDNSKKMFVGRTKNLLFGKNYITLITTTFFYIYILLSNKILFHKKNTSKFVITTIIILLILNITLFYLFTKRIY